jgi:hypothetical protein
VAEEEHLNAYYDGGQVVNQRAVDIWFLSWIGMVGSSRDSVLARQIWDGEE